MKRFFCSLFSFVLSVEVMVIGIFLIVSIHSASAMYEDDEFKVSSLYENFDDFNNLQFTQKCIATGVPPGAKDTMMPSGVAERHLPSACSDKSANWYMPAPKNFVIRLVLPRKGWPSGVHEGRSA